MEGADVGKLTIEFGGDFVRLVAADVETAGVGKNEFFLVQAQMYGVGAEPAGVACAGGWRLLLACLLYTYRRI